MTATPPKPNSPSAPRAPEVPPAGPTISCGSRQALWDTLALAALPLVIALALPAAFAGGGTRRWFGGRAESQRAEAQAAKDAA
ncbi:hypothetical protein ABZZ80_30190, partial [Streptomyces sp. NPDC006356]